jgi:hypothetical protein
VPDRNRAEARVLRAVESSVDWKDNDQEGEHACHNDHKGRARQVEEDSHEVGNPAERHPPVGSKGDRHEPVEAAGEVHPDDSHHIPEADEQQVDSHDILSEVKAASCNLLPAQVVGDSRSGSRPCSPGILSEEEDSHDPMV